MRPDPIGAALLWRADGAASVANDWPESLAVARAGSRYLDRVAERDGACAEQIASEGPQAVLSRALAAIAAAPDEIEAAMKAMRIAKRQAHLAIAVGDLSARFGLDWVTAAISAVADAAVAASARIAAVEMARRGEMHPVESETFVPGLVLVAMGKHGANELNYSSDIDFSVFFDAERLPTATGDPRRLAVRLAQTMVRILEEQTPEGYVFRTDLRLRPDPGSTAIAVSLSGALHYYQSVGQNWERAAFIKARPLVGGDVAATEEFLGALQTFIWRRHLDYAAIADVRSIKRQILSVHKGADLASGVFDVKLGRGGIRDIELFVQTQQLILGGREPNLRTPRTLDGLKVLSQSGRLDAQDADNLAAAYVFFRHVEHRIQMLNDEQTHRPPNDLESRARLAALCGLQDFAALEAQLLAWRRMVAQIDEALFGEEESLADPLGPLVFTGVEPDPDTLETLRKLGFANPVFVSDAVRGWHHGRVRAMRTERARELLTALTPRLLRALAESGDPDGAFARFVDFMAALPSGVQLFSLFLAQPQLLKALADVMGMAPALADTLARRPDLFDAMVSAEFTSPVGVVEQGVRRAAFADACGKGRDFEEAINAARRMHREELLRIGVQTLQGRASALDAGRAYADLADACVDALGAVSLREVERLHGAQPGAFVVLGLGKFGGGELAARSDLDMMLVYDAPPDTRSRGVKDVSPAEFYAKVAQRLVSALSAPTQEGALYAVDMQLRPSGSQGPVAVRLSAFERYYEQEAWTWELLALTRARVVAGEVGLAQAVAAATARALSRPRDGATIRRDAADMRARMDRERPPFGIWDLKLTPGGLVDVEFVAQTLVLARAAQGDGLLDGRANTGAVLDALRAAGELAEPVHGRLRSAWARYSDLQQILQIGVAGPFRPDVAPRRLLDLLAEAAGAGSFEQLERDLLETQTAVRADFRTLVGDGSGPLAR